MRCAWSLKVSQEKRFWFVSRAPWSAFSGNAKHGVIYAPVLTCRRPWGAGEGRGSCFTRVLWLQWTTFLSSWWAIASGKVFSSALAGQILHVSRGQRTFYATAAFSIILFWNQSLKWSSRGRSMPQRQRLSRVSDCFFVVFPVIYSVLVFSISVVQHADKHGKGGCRITRKVTKN